MEINIDSLGCVYCLSNPGLPGLYKIGETSKSAEKRLKQLNNTSIPFPYKVEFSKKVINSRDSEKEVHDYFKPYRVNTKKEFFNAQLQDIATYFNEQIIGEWEVKPPSNLTLNEQKANTLLKKSSIPITPQIKKDPIYKIDINEIQINNLTDMERDVLIDRCLKLKSIELRMLKGYYFIDNILKEEPFITNKMRFNAIINSPEMGYMFVCSDSFHEVLHELTNNAPQAFVELEEIFM
jgi:hypothetical protein